MLIGIEEHGNPGLRFKMSSATTNGITSCCLRQPRFENLGYPVPLLIVLILGFALQSCGAWAAADADRDGWYDGKRNQRVTLTLAGLTSNKQGDYDVAVDGVRFPHTPKNLQAVVHTQPETTLASDYDVASRAIGTWQRRAKDGQQAWDTEVTVTRSGTPAATGNKTIAWGNRPADQSVTIPLGNGEQVRLDFRTSVERFKDPDPRNRDGDADRDGIFDWEEAQYARQGVGLGDPGRRDLVLVVGHTHVDWRLTELARRVLRTRFHQRGINLYVVTNKKEGLGLATPGLMRLRGKTLPRDHAITLEEARRMRKAHLKGPMLHHAHLVVLAARVSSNPPGAWGFAELPGNTLVVRSHLPLVGPDFHQYQAKTLMHELGHNLGLCHPTQSDKRCPSGPIPKSERDPGLSVMGTPRTDRGNPMAVVRNAWARPLDYSPTQWKNARLDWVRPENRPKKVRRSPRR